MRIGILALQGDFEAHHEVLGRLGAETRPVRSPTDIEEIDGLVLPGGESTTIWMMMERSGLIDPVRAFAGGGRPVLATCAGAILCVASIEGSDQPSLGVADVAVRRNAYGRQRESFEAPLRISIPGRAAEKGLVAYEIVNLRDFTADRHQTVDDYPYGGGAGMVMKPEPFFEAVDQVQPEGPVVLLSARGRPFSHQDAVRFAVAPDLTLLCGHYKDVDQRVAEYLATEEISIGELVLSGGEVAALAIADAVARLLPGAIGDHDSASTDSFYEGRELSPPSYTRPAEYRGHRVPEVLLSGDHARIEAWRAAEARRLSRSRWPDAKDDPGES